MTCRYVTFDLEAIELSMVEVYIHSMGSIDAASSAVTATAPQACTAGP